MIPRYTGPLLPESIRRRIEQACEDVENPTGMSTNDGRGRFSSSDVRRLLALVDHLVRFAPK